MLHAPATILDGVGLLSASGLEVDLGVRARIGSVSSFDRVLLAALEVLPLKVDTCEVFIVELGQSLTNNSDILHVPGQLGGLLLRS